MTDAGTVVAVCVASAALWETRPQLRVLPIVYSIGFGLVISLVSWEQRTVTAVLQTTSVFGALGALAWFSIWVQRLQARKFPGPMHVCPLTVHDAISTLTATAREACTYDVRYQLTEIEVTGGVMLDRSYRWAETGTGGAPNDPGPNLDQLVDHRDPSESRFYFHDELDRLWNATDLSGNALFTHLYDSAGNRTSETTNAGTTTYAYMANTDKLLSATRTNARTFAHDPYCSRTCDTAGGCPCPRFVYDDTNRLVRLQIPSTGATHASYADDAFGRRVAKTASLGITTLFFYDPAGHLLEQISVVPIGDDYAQTAAWLEDEPIAGVARSKEAGTPAALPPGIAWAWPDEPGQLVPWLAAVAGGALLLGWLPTPRRPRAVLMPLSAGLARQSVECVPPPTGAFFWIHTDHLGAPIAMSACGGQVLGARASGRESWAPGP